MDMGVVDQDGRLGAADIPGRGVDGVDSTAGTADRLFPNSFKVTGIKHVCDNLVGSILEGMRQSFVVQGAWFDSHYTESGLIYFGNFNEVATCQPFHATPSQVTGKR